MGIYITSGFSNIATINNPISKVHYRLPVLRKFFKYTNFTTGKILNDSIIMSVIRYASPILISSIKNHILKLQVYLMRCSHLLLGYKSFKLSTQKIMGKLKWLTAYQIITKELVLWIRLLLFQLSLLIIWTTKMYKQ